MSIALRKGLLSFIHRFDPGEHFLKSCISSSSRPRFCPQKIASSYLSLSSKESYTYGSSINNGGSLFTTQYSHSGLTSSMLQPSSTLHCHLAVVSRSFSNSPTLCSESKKAHKLGKVAAKLGISYKCCICGSRNVHSFSKKAYEEGVVIVTCQSCNSHHLIADNIGWFKDVKGRNIEEILREKGEEVKKSGNMDIPDNLIDRVKDPSSKGEE